MIQPNFSLLGFKIDMNICRELWWATQPQEFCSMSEGEDNELEHLPSDGVLSLDYLTLELKAFVC